MSCSHLLMMLGEQAYGSSNCAVAPDLFRRAAECATTPGDVIRARRRQGNALLWQGRHAEALEVLLPVATCDRPDVEPDIVIAARTNVVAIAMHHAPFHVCRARLEEDETYCDAIGRPALRQRTGLVRAMVEWARGRHEDALAHARNADRLFSRSPCATPHSPFAHAKWVIRPLFALRRHNELARRVESLRKTPPGMLSDELRADCASLLELRLQLRRSNDPALRELIRDTARSAAHVQAQGDCAFDEVFEIARAMILAGDRASLPRLQQPPQHLFHFERAALAADSHINRLREDLGLSPWDPDLDWPPADDSRGAAAHIGAEDRAALRKVLDALERIARAEDLRMETDAFSRASAARRTHASTLLGEPIPDTDASTS